MICLNVGCGPFRAPKPWLNLDCHRGDGIEPDIEVDAERPLAGWADGTVDRVYLGHVLEHIPWDDELPGFLADIRRAMVPGGQLCAVGPDVLRVIQRWKVDADPEGWPLVESLLENPWDRAYGETGYDLVYETPRWRYGRHHWNSYEARIVFALRERGGFVDVTPQPITEGALGCWPVVAYTQWQCAVTAVAP